MAKLKDDQIKWILSLDAKGVQSELVELSSVTKKLEADNKRLQAEYKSASKQIKETRRDMEKLTKAGKEDSVEFKELEKTLESVSDEMTTYKKRIIENERTIKQNRRVTEEMVKTLKTEDMTMGQLKKKARDLEIQLENTSESTHPEAYSALEKELTKVESRMDTLKKGSQATTSVFKGGLMVLAGNVMMRAIDNIKEMGTAAVDWTKAGIELANKAEGQVNFFKNLEGGRKIMKDLKAATSDTISEIELMNKTIRAKELGVPIENMANLMDFARRQAQKLGKDVDYMGDSIVDGIGRKSTLILDNLGISATKVQAEVKKSGDFTQAVLKIVNEELAKQGDYALTSADKAAQAGAKWENAQLKVGERFKWLSDAWSKVSGDMADNISSLVDEFDTLKNQYDKQIDKVADLEMNTIPLIQRYEELKGKSSLTKDESIELNDILNTIASTIPGVITQFDRYGNALGINTDKVYEYIEAEKIRLKWVNRDLIKEQKDLLAKNLNHKKFLEKQIEQGTYYQSGISSEFGYEFKLSDEEIVKKQEEIAKVGEQIKGAELEIARLTGTTTEQVVEAKIKQSEAAKKFTNMNKKELDAWIKDEKNAADEYIETAKKIYDQRFGTNPTTDPKEPKGDPVLKTEKKELNSLLEKLETTHLKKMADIKEKFLKESDMSESEFNQKTFAQNQAYLLLQEEMLKNHLQNVTKQEVKDDINKRIAQIQDQRISQEIKFRSQLEQIILNANPEEKEKREYEKRLRDLGLFGKTKLDLQLELIAAETDQEKALLQQKIEALELLETQHQDNLFAIRQQAKNREQAQAESEFNEAFNSRKEELQLELNEMQQNLALMGNSSFEAEMAVHLKKLEMIQEEIAARKKAGLETSRLVAQLGKTEAQVTATLRKETANRTAMYSQYAVSLGNATGAVLSGQKSAFEAFGDSMIDILFDILTNIINAKIVEATAVAVAEQAKAAAIAAAMPDSVTSFGATAAIRTAAIGALIMGALQVAKSALKGMIGKKSASADSSSGSGQRVSSSGFAEGGLNDSGITGGYTGDGGRYELATIFSNGAHGHRREYIVPDPVMKLPAAVPLIRALEQLRQPYSTKNPLPNGFAEGGFNGEDLDSSAYDPRRDTAITQSLDKLNSTLDRFMNHEFSVNYQNFLKAKDITDRAKRGASKR